MVIKASNPAQSFEKKWYFEIIENEYRLLELNAINMLDGLTDSFLGIQVRPLNFVYTKYQQSK